MGQQTADLGRTVIESGILHLDTAQVRRSARLS
jgi:hypothetical protein